MKKIMIAAAAMAIVGSASAVTVFDYRATVRHPYLREVSVTVGGVQYNVYTKYLTSTTIRGYLIQDEEATLNGGRETAVSAGAGGTAFITGPVTVPQPENRCFLVAINQAAGRYTYPRIIPGIIEAKFWNPQFRAGNSVPVQAYLWLGGELAATAVPSIGAQGVDGLGAFQVFGHKNAVALANGTIAAEGPATFPVAGNLAAYGNAGAKISSYAFTSEYLFGQFNQKAGNATAFADCWLNGAGFGQAGAWDGGECCGWATSAAGMSINNLQGNLKGGLRLCSLNGEQRMHQILPFGDALAAAGRAQSRFDRQLWGDYDDLNALGGAFAGVRADWVDLWTDGPLELGTTDCASGSFSLRRVTQNMSQALDFAGAEAVLAGPAAGWNGTSPVANRTAASSNDGTLELLQTIKGCMLSLNRNARMCGTDLAAAPNNAAVPTALFGPTFYNAYLAQ